MRHQMVHSLLLCNIENWGELEYIKNRRGEEENKDQKLIDMYKSQDGRYEDPQ